jgi:hypothetical protein
MIAHSVRRLDCRRFLLPATTVIAPCVVRPVLALTQATEFEEVIVTGFRRSLEEPTAAKGIADGFEDSATRSFRISGARHRLCC